LGFYFQVMVSLVAVISCTVYYHTLSFHKELSLQLFIRVYQYFQSVFIKLLYYLHSVYPYKDKKQPYRMLKKSVIYIMKLVDTKWQVKKMLVAE
jgi:hypothetical protein